MTADIPKFKIRLFQDSDRSDVIELWHRCNLVVPQNDPQQDIDLKLRAQPDLFFVGTVSNRIVATVMAGYDGHRGWIYYLAVDGPGLSAEVYRPPHDGASRVRASKAGLSENQFAGSDFKPGGDLIL
jgi:hypothetical protein